MRLLPVLLLACTAAAPKDDGDGTDTRETDTGEASAPPDHTDDETAETGPTDPPDTDPGPRWATYAPLQPARQEHGTTVFRGELVVVGGYVDAGPLDRVDAWSPESDTWRPLADLPEPLHHPNLAAVGDTLVVAGFLVGTFPAFVAKGTVYRYDPDGDRWTLGTPMPAGTARGASVTLVHDDRVWVLGGIGVDAVATASIYDPALDTWTPLPDLPTARDHAAGGVLGTGPTVVGGRRISLESSLGVVEAWDPAQAAWTTLPALPRPRGGLAAAVLDGRLYALGGEGDLTDPDLMFRDVDAWDPAQGTWTSLAAMPRAVHGTAAVTLQGRLWLAGGGTRAGLQPTDALQAFDPQGR